VLYVSPAYEKIWGRSRESLYEEPRSWLNLVHEADRDQIVAAIEANSRGDFSKPQPPDYRVVRDDGSVRWVSARSFPVRNESGEIYRVVGIVEDVTERKKAQDALARTSATLNSILTSSTEYAIAATDLELRVIQYNPAAERMFGFPLEEVMGERVEHIHEKAGVDPARVPLALDRAINKGKWETELKRSGLDGHQRIIVPVVTPMRDEQGKLIGYVVLARDITDQRHAEAARERLESQVRQIHKLQAIGQLAAGVAHDFNTVLAVILGNAELLQNECKRRRLRDPKESISSALKLIVSSVERGQKLVQNLLAFGRARSWNPRPINLNRRVDQVRKLLEDVLGRRIKLVVRKEQNLRTVIADAGHIEQALMNLLLNARDAMPAGGEVTIETANVDLDDAYVAAHAEAQPGPHVVLSVTDTGTGVDESAVERLFEPFFTTKRVGQGTGLGLSIVYGIVRQAGGHITVASEVGSGTQFSLYFPAIQ
jgi:PAS domain S-box-containing protein